MNIEECLFRTVMMMEKQLQGEGSFISDYRLINYVVVNLNKYIYISPIIKIIYHGCQKCDGGSGADPGGVMGGR